MSKLDYVNLTCMNNNVNNKCNYIKPDKLSKILRTNPRTNDNFSKEESDNFFKIYKNVCNSNNGNVKLCCSKDLSNYTDYEINFFNELKEVFKSVKVIKKENKEIEKIILSIIDNTALDEWEELSPYLICKIIKSSVKKLNDNELEFTKILDDCFNNMCADSPEFSVDNLVGAKKIDSVSQKTKENDDIKVETFIKNKSFKDVKNYLLKYQNDYHKPLIHNKKYNSLLHYSVKHDYKYLVEFLIQSNVNINIKNAEGNTPLHLAVLIKNYEITHLLNKLGADINVKNNNLETPIFLAVKNGDLNMLTFLYRNNASLNEKDINNNNLIHVSIQQYPKYTIVNSLLDKGLELSETNKEGLTPIDILEHKLREIKYCGKTNKKIETQKTHLNSILSLVSRRNFKNKYGSNVLETSNYKDFVNVKDWICYDKNNNIKEVQNIDKCEKKLGDNLVPIENNLELKLSNNNKKEEHYKKKKQFYCEKDEEITNNNNNNNNNGVKDWLCYDENHNLKNIKHKNECDKSLGDYIIPIKKEVTVSKEGFKNNEKYNNKEIITITLIVIIIMFILFRK